LATPHELNDVECELVDALDVLVDQEEKLLGCNSFDLEIVAFSEFVLDVLYYFVEEL
jgi:hypothetical protein